jgi:hypothetical protein
MLFSAARKGRSRYLDNYEGKADRRASPDQIPTYCEWHFEGSGPFQGFLSQGISTTAAGVAIRLFGATCIFFRAGKLVVKRDKLNAERVG